MGCEDGEGVAAAVGVGVVVTHFSFGGVGLLVGGSGGGGSEVGDKGCVLIDMRDEGCGLLDVGELRW